MVGIEGCRQDSLHWPITHLQAALRVHGRDRDQHEAKHMRLPLFGNRSVGLGTFEEECTVHETGHRTRYKEKAEVYAQPQGNICQMWCIIRSYERFYYYTLRHSLPSFPFAFFNTETLWLGVNPIHPILRTSNPNNGRICILSLCPQNSNALL